MDPDNLPDIIEGDLTDEEYREYEFGDGQLMRTYRIGDPKKLFMRRGGTTHRILDAAGLVHCVPAPGFMGCVLRWRPRDPAHPVKF